MTDLVEFLRARLDEDERVARAAAPGPWRMDENQRIYADDGAYVTAPWTEDERDDDLDHVARHDPARVLREVARDRRILAAHHRSGLTCPRCSLGTEGGEVVFERDPCETLRLLALPFADHPDYQQEWNLNQA